MKNCFRTSRWVLEHEFEKSEYHNRSRLPRPVQPPYGPAKKFPCKGYCVAPSKREYYWELGVFFLQKWGDL